MNLRLSFAAQKFHLLRTHFALSLYRLSLILQKKNNINARTSLCQCETVIKSCSLYFSLLSAQITRQYVTISDDLLELPCLECTFPRPCASLPTRPEFPIEPHSSFISPVKHRFPRYGVGQLPTLERLQSLQLTFTFTSLCTFHCPLFIPPFVKHQDPLLDRKVPQWVTLSHCKISPSTLLSIQLFQTKIPANKTKYPHSSDFSKFLVMTNYIRYSSYKWAQNILCMFIY